MDQKRYIFLTGLVFFVIAIVHAVRLVSGWQIIVEGWQIPMEVSYGVLVLAAILGLTGYRLSK